MSSSPQGLSNLSFPANAFLYRDVGPVCVSHDQETISDAESSAGPIEDIFPASQVATMMAIARNEVIVETENRLRVELEARVAKHSELIQAALERFIEERQNYFNRVESDVVHLALAIAAKILHRESQVDSMLVAALVRVAVQQLHDGSRVTVRVAASDFARWKAFFANPLNGTTVEVADDAHLAAGDCVLETDLGSANFSIDAQLKEVEQGFFDLLAQRPAVR